VHFLLIESPVTPVITFLERTVFGKRRVVSEETKQKIRDKAKARWADAEFKAKASAALTDFWANADNKARMSGAMTAAYTEERKERLSASLKAHERTPEHAAAISNALQGKPNWARGTTKETNEAQARKSLSARRAFLEKAKVTGIRVFPGQRQGIDEHGLPVRYCMCSPLCMAPVKRSGRMYYGNHGASTEQVRLALSRALTGKPKPAGHGEAVRQARLGTHHSPATRRAIGKSKEGKPNWGKGLTKHTDVRIRKISDAKVGKMPASFTFRVDYTRPDGTVVTMRSNWELAYAQWMTARGIEWRYEAKTFPFEMGGEKTSYTPDFYLPAYNEFVEVKGYYSEVNRAKMLAFYETYPSVRVRMIFKDEMKNVLLDLSRMQAALEDAES